MEGQQGGGDPVVGVTFRCEHVTIMETFKLGVLLENTGAELLSHVRCVLDELEEPYFPGSVSEIRHLFFYPRELLEGKLDESVAIALDNDKSLRGQGIEAADLSNGDLVFNPVVFLFNTSPNVPRVQEFAAPAPCLS
jgi:hypothetical protein